MDLRHTSSYWYSGGVEWRATISWALGIVAGYCFTTARVSATEVWFSGPLASTWFGHNGLGWAIAFGVAAILYFGLGGARGSGTEAVVESKNVQTTGVR